MEKPLTILLSDFVITLISCIPGVLTIATEYVIISELKETNIIFIILSLLLIPFIFIFFIFVMRLILPKMKEGRFNMSFNKGFIAWGLNLALGRSIRIFQLQDLIYSSHLLKYLYWRSMGAKIKFGVNSSMYINLVDLPLIEVGKGSMLGDEVQISCHLIQGNAIYLKKVSVGDNSFIGIHSKLGPGTKIGNNCSIGPWNFFLRKKIKDNETVKPFEYFN